VSAVVTDAPRGGSWATVALAAVAVATFGLVGGLPDFLGPTIGLVGLVLSSLLRRRRPAGAVFGPLPALAALGAIAVSAPPVPSAELLGGLATLAVLLWLADDPERPAGGGRRAAPALAGCGLALGIAWSVVLAVPPPSGAIGVAGAILASIFLLIAYLIVREAEGPSPSGASA